MRDEKQFLEDVLSAQELLGVNALKILVEPYADHEFVIPKVKIEAISDTYARLAQQGTSRQTILSVVNGAEMVAHNKADESNLTNRIHDYAYSPDFANYSAWFEANVTKDLGNLEQHFFIHGIAKAIYMKKIGWPILYWVYIC